MARLDEQDIRAQTAYRRLLAAIIALDLAAIFFTPLGLAPDEAHYWEWSRRLDWSYYSKGPLVALAIRAGTALFGPTGPGVRFPALVFFAAALVLLWRILLLVSPPRAALPIWLCGLSMIILLQSGLVMTTDAPCAACWLAGIYCALRTKDDRRWWIGAGAAVGVGFLAKFTTAALFASLVLFVCLSRRRDLKSPWIYLGALTACIAVVPVLYWNSQNDWVNFSHNAGHVVRGAGGKAASFHLPELIGGQLGMIGPLLFVMLMAVLPAGWRRWREGDETAGLLLWSSLPLLILCILVSFTKSVYPNWPLPVYLGLLPLAAHLQIQGAAPTVFSRLIAPSLKLNCFLALLAYLLFFGVTAGLPPEILPSKKLAGWGELGKTIDGIFAGRQFEAVVAEDYGLASEAAFYSSSHPRAMCAVTGDRRMNQYDVWGGWENLKNKDLLIVMKSPQVPQELAEHFSSVTPVGPESGLSVRFGKAVLHSYYFFSGSGYDGTVPPRPARR